MGARLAALATAVSLCVAASALAQQAPAPPPPDDGTAVSDLVVSAPPAAVPIPDVGEGAPALSPDEIQRVIFARRAVNGGFPQAGPGGEATPFRSMEAWERINHTITARTVTQYAERIRREAARGLRTQKEVEEAELARQAAMLKAFGPRLRAPAIESIRLAPASATLEGFRAGMAVEGGRQLLVVAGMLRNVADKTVRAPLLTITVLDAQGFVLAAKTFNPSVRLQPGQTRAFAYRFVDPPANLKDVRIAVSDTVAGIPNAPLSVR